MESRAEIRIERVGREGAPVIVIDGFVAEPQSLEGFAQTCEFAAMGAHYPGLRAMVPTPLVAQFVAPVADLIAATFGVTPQLGLIEAMFSLVTTAPEQLRPIQRLPHFDGCEPERLALLHYLGGCADGGTSFYRHRSTGFETVDAARLSQYNTALHRDVAEQGMPAPVYIAGDTPLFERTAHFAGHYNRALIYRGHMLHCADIPPGTPLSSDPHIGRLTVNTFLMGTAS